MNIVIRIVAVGAVLVAIPAFAQPYLGLGVGSSNSDNLYASHKIFAGIQATEYFGSEIALNDFVTSHKASAKSLSLAVIGTLPLNQYWEFFGKLGESINTGKGSVSSRHIDWLKGVGAGYNFNQRIALRLEYEDFGKLPNNANGAIVKVYNWGLNVKYFFE